MTSQRISLFTFLAVVQILIALIVSSAGYIYTNIEAPGALRSSKTFHRVGFEHFDDLYPGYHSNYESNFGLGSLTDIRGTYDTLTVKYNDRYGGSGTFGKYAVAYQGYKTKLYVRRTGRTGAGFFGLYWASIDASNYLEFFNQGVSIYNYTGADAYKLISSLYLPNAWYGNRYSSDWFYARHSRQAYGYFSFYFQDPLFDEVRFGDKAGAGFESDNHSIGDFPVDLPRQMQP